MYFERDYDAFFLNIHEATGYRTQQICTCRGGRSFMAFLERQQSVQGPKGQLTCGGVGRSHEKPARLQNVNPSDGTRTVQVDEYLWVS